jgi:protein gp37
MFNVSMVEDDDLPPLEAPYKNVWLGVSAENQETADERIPFLLATPASIKFLSCEPLLEPIDLRKHLVGNIVAKMLKGYGAKAKVPEYLAPPPGRLDWVIAGGESGRNARPCYLDWLRSLRDQCYSADVSYFVKQLGSNSFSGGGIDKPIKYTTLDSKGEVFDEFPEDLKIRETPKAYYND